MTNDHGLIRLVPKRFRPKVMLVVLVGKVLLANWAQRLVRPRPTPWRPKVLVLAVLLVASAALACSLFWFQYRTEHTTHSAAARGAAVRAATDGTVAVLSYDADTFDRDFSSAEEHLTGAFLQHYKDFAQNNIAPAAKQNSVRTKATVVGAAVSELSQSSAVVLVMVNQTTSNAKTPDPILTSSSVRVTLTKLDGAWRISSFDPV